MQGKTHMKKARVLLVAIAAAALVLTGCSKAKDENAARSLDLVIQLKQIRTSRQSVSLLKHNLLTQVMASIQLTLNSMETSRSLT